MYSVSPWLLIARVYFIGIADTLNVFEPPNVISSVAAVPSAALDVASEFIPLGRGMVGKLLGPKAAEILGKGSKEAIERQARETLLQSVSRGAAVGTLTEVPTEVAQQMIERIVPIRQRSLETQPKAKTPEPKPGGFQVLQDYLVILVTVPAPTVRPPSRIAKRRPSSMAIGWISSTAISVVSPGITISVPAGRVITPVTSVVRK